MRRRILLAQLVIVIAAVLAFGLPLGAVVARLTRQQAVLRLERQATRAALEVPVPLAVGNDPPDLPDADPGTRLALYDATGERRFGDGPPRPDGVVLAAAAGRVNDGTVGEELVVAVPVASNETVVAVVRAATARSAVDRRVRLAWLGTGGLAAAVLAVAAIGATVLARRLAAPVIAVARATRRLGDGDFSVRVPPVGIAELDEAADAIEATADRLGRLLERERAFSADASHQLRTPLTALRLALDSAAADPANATTHLAAASAATDRIETTVTDLLALARDTVPPTAALDLRPVLDQAQAAWNGPFAQAGRSLQLTAPAEGVRVRAAEATVRQVLDVLLANALEHGSGQVDLSCRPLGTATAVEVTDEGPGLADPAAAFARRPRSGGRGIGLALARSLAEAEGGRLLADPDRPTTFRLLLPSPTQDAEAGAPTR